MSISKTSLKSILRCGMPFSAPMGAKCPKLKKMGICEACKAGSGGAGHAYNSKQEGMI